MPERRLSELRLWGAGFVAMQISLSSPIPFRRG